jgi:hypothetical protein
MCRALLLSNTCRRVRCEVISENYTAVTHLRLGC